MDHLVYSARKNIKSVGGIAAMGLAVYGASRLMKWIARERVASAVRFFGTRILHDSYDENLWELVHVTKRLSVQTLVEDSLRSEITTPIARPMGSRRKFDEFDKLLFDFAILSRSPRPANLTVDTSVTIGPKAGRPMKIETPIIVAGMAYKLALTAEAKLALAKGAAKAGTATNSGEGIPAPGEMEAANKYILQLSRACWNRDPRLIRKADAIEVQLGQGATGGTGKVVEVNNTGVIFTEFPEIQGPRDLPKVVKMLRNYTDVPIGVKIGAGKFLEEDIQMLIDADVDYIWLDGAQAATHGAAPILQDDHGLPTFYAVSRASRYLQQQGVSDTISLIVSGGLFTPGDFLKCLALGAKAVGIGTATLIAISHGSVLDVLPWEPPTQMVWETGKNKKAFNVEKGAEGLYNFLTSCKEEMVVSARALGKPALREFSRADMVAVDPYVAAAAGVDLAHVPQPLGKGSSLQPESVRNEHRKGHMQAVENERTCTAEKMDLNSIYLQ